ncbi:MAG: hypothetical protein IK031_06045, partial [Bacteroidales bacterium]|nr:hypothetical protein [Bacteroidales bacterium]
MAVIATGFFDGVHPGHRLVIDTLLSEARARGEQSVVVTFWPHPRAVLQSDADSLRYLTSQSEKMELLRGLGVDAVETIPFTRKFAAMSAGEYIRMLVSRFGCTELVLGYDTRFGYEQAGPEQIAELAARMGLDALIAPPVCIDRMPVSSTRIREALEAGDVASAARLLGRPYRLHGVVVAGNRLGRTIGFPTANMKLYEPLMAIPKNGVYATRVSVGDRSFAIAQDDRGVMPASSSSVISVGDRSFAIAQDDRGVMPASSSSVISVGDRSFAIAQDDRGVMPASSSSVISTGDFSSVISTGDSS